MAWEKKYISEGLELDKFANIRRAQIMLEFLGAINYFYLNQP